MTDALKVGDIRNDARALFVLKNRKKELLQCELQKDHVTSGRAAEVTSSTNKHQKHHSDELRADL